MLINRNIGANFPALLTWNSPGLILLNDTRRHYMKQPVNGASLHALLAKIPYPKQPQPVPASVSIPALAAVTGHV